VFNVLPKILNAFHSRNKISVTANQGGGIVSIVLGKAKHIHCNIYDDHNPFILAHQNPQNITGD